MNAFLIPVLIIGFLIFVNGIFVAAEFAIVVAPYSRIARWVEEGKEWRCPGFAVAEGPS